MSSSRGRIPTYLIGRGAQADIVLSDSTVSRQHAELVRSKGGSWYLTDRCSSGGTYLRSGDRWTPVTQEFVRAGDRLKFGAFECSLDELLRRLPTGAEGPSNVGGGLPEAGSPVLDDRPAGAVLRDPATGEILTAEDE